MGYFCSLDVIYEANHVRVSSMDVVLGAIQYNTTRGVVVIIMMVYTVMNDDNII